MYVCAQLESWGWGSSEYVGVAKCVDFVLGLWFGISSNVLFHSHTLFHV